MISEKSIAGFEPASFSRPVQILKFCNAIPTRPLGTWNGIDVKLFERVKSNPHGLRTFLYHSKNVVQNK